MTRRYAEAMALGMRVTTPLRSSEKSHDLRKVHRLDVSRTAWQRTWKHNYSPHHPRRTSLGGVESGEEEGLLRRKRARSDKRPWGR